MTSKNIAAKLKAEFRRATQVFGNRIRICWTERPEGYDPELESTWSDGMEHDEEFYALVHFVSPERIVQRGFTEIEGGDCILDMCFDDFDPDGKDDVKIRILDKWWGAKAINGQLAESWDVAVGGEGISRTFLLSPMK